MNLKLILITVLISALLPALIYEQQYRPMYKDLSGVMMHSTPDHTDVLVIGKRNHFCLIKSINALIELNGIMVPAGNVEFLNKFGEKIPVESQRIPVSSKFVRLGRITPGSNHVQLFVTAKCVPFLTRKYLFLDVHSELPGT
jgi:hypothetical protein